MMTQSVQSPRLTVLRRVFFGPRELRAGWRLLIFLAIVVTLINASNFIVRRLLGGTDQDTLFLVREIMDFLIVVLTSWIMGRFECRTLADYGLPWRKMFHSQFWQGALLGFGAITGLLAAMRVARVFYFGAVALHGSDIAKWRPSTRLFSLSSLFAKNSALADTHFSRSQPASVSGLPQFYRRHISATRITVTRERTGSVWSTRACLGYSPAFCSVEPVISGCRLEFIWPSIGARRTFTVCPTAAVSSPRAFSELDVDRSRVALRRHRGPRGKFALHFADNCLVVDLRSVAARGQISEARPGPGTKCTRST